METVRELERTRASHYGVIRNAGMNLSSRVNVVRPILGFLLTPAVAPVATILIAFVVTKEYRGDCLYGWVVGLTILFGVAGSYISAAVFGVPYVLIMQRIGRLSFWTIMIGALGQWAGLFVSLFMAGFLRTGQLDFAGILAVFGVLYLPGMLLGGVVFYRIAVR
jgi:hypothetical protein